MYVVLVPVLEKGNPSRLLFCFSLGDAWKIYHGLALYRKAMTFFLLFFFNLISVVEPEPVKMNRLRSEVAECRQFL